MWSGMRIDQKKMTLYRKLTSHFNRQGLIFLTEGACHLVWNHPSKLS